MEPSWHAFLARYRDMARAIASDVSGRPSEAEDLVQEAALALFAAWRRDATRFASQAHARNYFLRALRNLALRARERGARSEPLELEPADRGDDEARRVLERQRALGALLATLPEAERDLVRRRFLMRQTLAEVARETRTPLSTLHARERALLGRLRRRLDASLEEDR